MRLHTRHVALRCQPEDVAHELLPDALSRIVAGYEEVIDLSIRLQLGISDGLRVGFRHERLDAADALMPLGDVVVGRGPGFALFGRVSAGGDAVHGRTKDSVQERLVPNSESAYDDGAGVEAVRS